MQELTMGVSWTGVIVGAIAAFIVGWLWYSPMLFGKRWAEDQGLELGSASEMPMAAMGAQALGLFLMSWFVGVTAVSSALLTVILATLAFTILAGSGGMFAKQSAYVRHVNAGYWVVSLVVMIISQGIFKGMSGA
ncbi:MAG: hypothetical protein ACI861_002557 [Paracoccaceae bacterium]|jgi:hypothetical protein